MRVNQILKSGIQCESDQFSTIRITVTASGIAVIHVMSLWNVVITGVAACQVEQKSRNSYGCYRINA